MLMEVALYQFQSMSAKVKATKFKKNKKGFEMSDKIFTMPGAYTTEAKNIL